jgi:hypothetical protein
MKFDLFGLLKASLGVSLLAGNIAYHFDVI